MSFAVSLLSQLAVILGFIAFSLLVFEVEASIACTISILFMVSLRFFTQDFIFPHLADYFKLENGTDQNRPRDKFIYNCWLFTVHVLLLTALIWYHIVTERLSLAMLPWSHYNWDHSFFTMRSLPFALDDNLTWMYALQVGFYVTEMLALFFHNPPGDYYESLAHHISTMALILGSIYFWRASFGVFIMLIHEVAEPLIVGGKLTHYAKLDTTSNFFFVSFVAVWIPSRCITYTYWMYILPTAPWRSFGEKVFMLTFLYSLQFLHWYWTILICKVAYGILGKGLFNMKITDEMDHSYSGKNTSELDKLKMNYRSSSSNLTKPFSGYRSQSEPATLTMTNNKPTKGMGTVKISPPNNPESDKKKKRNST